MKRVIVSLIVILLIVPLIPYAEDFLTGYLMRAEFAKDYKKFFAGKEKYIMLPNQNSLKITLTAKDNFVWKSGWYCKQPCIKQYDWVTFDFEGDILLNSEDLRWMNGKEGRQATSTIPKERLKNGKNYFAAYTCEGVNKCNGNKWLLLPVEVVMLSEAADVSVSSVYFDFPEKNTGSFFIIIKNSGTADSQSGVLSYRITDIVSDKVIAENWMVMPSVLKGKTSVTNRVKFHLGETTKASISIVLDAGDKIIESDEKNNEYYMIKEFNPRYPETPR